jgi:ribosomal protein S27AE
MQERGATQEALRAGARLPWVFTEERCPDCGDEVVLALGELGDTRVECGCGSILVLI